MNRGWVIRVVDVWCDGDFTYVVIAVANYYHVKNKLKNRL